MQKERGNVRTGGGCSEHIEKEREYMPILHSALYQTRHQPQSLFTLGCRSLIRMASRILRFTKSGALARTVAL